MKTWQLLAALGALLLSLVANAGELAAKSYTQGEFSYATGPAPAFVKVRNLPATWDAPSASLPGNCKKLPVLGELCPYQRCAALAAYCDASTHCAPLGLPGAPCTAHGG